MRFMTWNKRFIDFFLYFVEMSPFFFISDWACDCVRVDCVQTTIAKFRTITLNWILQRKIDKPVNCQAISQRNPWESQLNREGARIHNKHPRWIHLIKAIILRQRTKHQVCFNKKNHHQGHWLIVSTWNHAKSSCTAGWQSTDSRGHHGTANLNCIPRD